MAELVNKARILKEFNISTAAFNNYSQMGMPCADQGRGGQTSKYDLEAVRAWLQENVKSQNEELNQAKLRKAIADASLAELELEKERGLVIPIADVIERVGAEYTNIRAKLLGLASQLCDELAVLNDKKSVKHLLESKIREILEELTADDLQPVAEKKARKTKTTKE